MEGIFGIGFVLVVVVFSIICHEVAHGAAALKFGDTTARDAGRITLNPIPHIDPVGSILMPLLGILLGGFIIAWAKPVPVNSLRLKPFRLGLFCVAVAGIATNIFLAWFAAMLARIFLALDFAVLAQFLVPVIVLNLILGFFNLLPIPPLDGSKIFFSVFNFSAEQQARIEASFAFIGFILLMFLFISGTLSFVFQWAYTATSWLLGA